MKPASLIGKEILDIYAHIEAFEEFKDFGLRKAECYYLLSGDILIGLPFYIDDEEVWIKELHPMAKSYYPAKKWWQKKSGYDKIKNSKIRDILYYPNETHASFIELESGVIITEETVAPIGIEVGLRSFASIDQLEELWGKEYIRLTDYKFNV